MAERGLLLSPGVAQMYTTGEIAANICLETPGLDTLDILVLWKGSPTIASTRTIFVNAALSKAFYLEQNEYAEWPADGTIYEVAVPGNSTRSGLALPWGGTSHPVWFARDPRVANCRALAGTTPGADGGRAEDRRGRARADRRPLDDEAKYEALSEQASAVMNEMPPRENHRINISMDSVHATGPLGHVHCILRGACNYKQTGLLQAYAAHHLVNGSPRRVGFASGCQAFGHRELLGVLQSFGLQAALAGPWLGRGSRAARAARPGGRRPERRARCVAGGSLSEGIEERKSQWTWKANEHSSQAPDAASALRSRSSTPSAAPASRWRTSTPPAPRTPRRDAGRRGDRLRLRRHGSGRRAEGDRRHGRGLRRPRRDRQQRRDRDRQADPGDVRRGVRQPSSTSTSTGSSTGSSTRFRRSPKAAAASSTWPPLAGLGGVPLLGAYCASKAAVIRLTQTAAIELRDAGIRVNAICPSFIDTEMVERLVAPFEAATGAEFDDLAAQAQGRLGTPGEVAEMAAFLASDDASFVTGSYYVLDNALTASGSNDNDREFHQQPDIPDLSLNPRWRSSPGARRGSGARSSSRLSVCGRSRDARRHRRGRRGGGGRRARGRRGRGAATSATRTRSPGDHPGTVFERHGHLDVFVNNAGIATVNPLVKMSLEEWREVLAVDLDGVSLCTKHAALAMVAGGGGSIINIASIKAFGGSPATGHYGAAKAGVVSLTKTAALELRDWPGSASTRSAPVGWAGTWSSTKRKSSRASSGSTSAR